MAQVLAKVCIESLAICILCISRHDVAPQFPIEGQNFLIDFDRCPNLAAPKTLT